MAGRAGLPVSFGGHDHNIIYMGCDCCVDHIVADFLKWGGFGLLFCMGVEQKDHAIVEYPHRRGEACARLKT